MEFYNAMIAKKCKIHCKKSIYCIFCLKSLCIYLYLFIVLYYMFQFKSSLLNYAYTKIVIILLSLKRVQA
jgi:hypothetical protein